MPNDFDPFVSISPNQDIELIDNYLNRTAVFTLEKMKLYKRSPLWVREQFDDDHTEGSKNEYFMWWEILTGMAMPDHPERIILNGNLWNEQIELPDGSHYWCLSCTGGWFDIGLANNKNSHNLYEIFYEYGCVGLGGLDIWVNGIPTESIKGPTAWLSSVPHKSLGGINVRCRVVNYALSDPAAKGQIDNFRAYYYTPVDCIISKYAPPKTTATPTEIKTLRGFSAFQTTKYIGTECPLTLRFENESEHASFQRDCDRPYVLVDDKGILYRGTIELGEVRWFGRGIYEQDINFKSPNKLGEGWI
jgi:hypothetical protein